MKKNKKLLALVCCMVLLVGAVGATLAWLTDQTAPKVNTFTVGNVGIDLTEEKEDFKMIPGFYIEKDPKVTVDANSVDSFIFVEVTESTNKDFDEYLKYSSDAKWTADWKEFITEDLDGDDEADYYVLYTEYKTDAEAKSYYVLDNNQVVVKDTVDKSKMNAIDGLDDEGNTVQAEIGIRPTLTFKAYAVQMYKTNNQPFTIAEAWAKAKPVTP